MRDADSRSPITDPERLAALRRTGLLDTGAEDEFDQITALAAKLLGTPTALVSLVDADRQFFKSVVGLGEPWGTARQTGLDLSVCQHVVGAGETLAVADTREHPLVREQQKLADTGIVAYAGTPLTTADGQTIGSFCVIDHKPREWKPDELRLLSELADAVVALIERRRAAAPQTAAGAGAAADADAAPRALADADRLWEAADRYLVALDDYDAVVERVRERRGALAEERTVRDRVAALERELLATAEGFGRGAPAVAALPPALAAAARALWLAALYLIERVTARRAAGARFQQGAEGLEPLEHASTLVRSAQRELEQAATAYRQARLERRARAR